MTLKEMKPIEEWEEILRRFSTDVKMTTCLADAEGNPIRCVSDRYPLCTAIRDNPDSLTFICSQTSTVMTAVVRKTRKPEVDLCQAGLVRLVVPIVHEGEMIGQINACGLVSEGEEIESFMIAKQLGLSEEEVLELAGKTPSASEKELGEFAEKLFAEVGRG
jgi:ligand-binding sensor protein